MISSRRLSFELNGAAQHALLSLAWPAPFKSPARSPLLLDEFIPNSIFASREVRMSVPTRATMKFPQISASKRARSSNSLRRMQIPNLPFTSSVLRFISLPKGIWPNSSVWTLHCALPCRGTKELVFLIWMGGHSIAPKTTSANAASASP